MGSAQLIQATASELMGRLTQRRVVAAATRAEMRRRRRRVKEQSSVEDMQKEIGEVEACRAQSPQMAIESQREPVERTIGGPCTGGGKEFGRKVDRCREKSGEDVMPVREIGIANNLSEIVIDEGALEGCGRREGGSMRQ